MLLMKTPLPLGRRWKFLFGPWGSVLINEGDGKEDVDVSGGEKEEEGKRRSNEVIACFGTRAHVWYGTAGLRGRN